jgi:hypothetical protein
MQANTKTKENKNVQRQCRWINEGNNQWNKLKNYRFLDIWNTKHQGDHLMITNNITLYIMIYIIRKIYFMNHPSLNMYLSLNIFQYFPHSLTKLSEFCVIGGTNWKATNVLWALKKKEQHIKDKKRMRDSLQTLKPSSI